MQPISSKPLPEDNWFTKGLDCREAKAHTKALSCFKKALSLWEKEKPIDAPYSEFAALMKLLNQRKLYNRAKKLIPSSKEMRLVIKLKVLPKTQQEKEAAHARWNKLQRLSPARFHTLRAKLFVQHRQKHKALVPAFFATQLYLQDAEKRGFWGISKLISSLKLASRLYESMGYPHEAEQFLTKAITALETARFFHPAKWFKTERAMLQIKAAAFANTASLNKALKHTTPREFALYRSSVRAKNSAKLYQTLAACINAQENVPLIRTLAHTLSEMHSKPAIYHALSIGISSTMQHLGTIFPVTLPENWVMLCISVCPSGLRISRWQGASSPVSFLSKAPFSLEQFDAITLESSATLKRVIATDEDKKTWWRDRIALDKRLKEHLAAIEEQVLGEDRSLFKADAPIILVLGQEVQRFPWESLPTLQSHEVTRMPSVAQVVAGLKKRTPHVPVKTGFYVLNPSRDLSKNQELFETHFSKERLWDGVSGRAPTAEECKKALKEYDLYVYCGHDSGEQYLNRYAFRLQVEKVKSIALLMGCKSLYKRPQGLYDGDGIVDMYMNADCPAVVGTLWDATDVDLDRLLKNFLVSWLDQKDESKITLLQALAHAKNACRLKYLNGASTVVYGLPR